MVAEKKHTINDIWSIWAQNHYGTNMFYMRLKRELVNLKKPTYHSFETSWSFWLWYTRLDSKSTDFTK